MDKYYLTLDKENSDIGVQKVNYFVSKDQLELVWSESCDEETAKKRFSDLVEKQSRERLVSGKKWRIVRLFNSLGNQVLQES